MTIEFPIPTHLHQAQLTLLTPLYDPSVSTDHEALESNAHTKGREQRSTLEVGERGSEKPVGILNKRGEEKNSETFNTGFHLITLTMAGTQVGSRSDASGLGDHCLEHLKNMGPF